MARFILEYDVLLTRKTKIFIMENITASMNSSDSSQYCLEDLIELLILSDISEVDIETLNQLKNEGVDYVEVCF